MAMFTLMKSGYTLRVSSSENDGDIPMTRDVHIDTKGVLKAVLALCEVCKDNGSRDSDLIGNAMEDDNFYAPIVRFMIDHPILYPEVSGVKDNILNSVVTYFNKNKYQDEEDITLDDAMEFLDDYVNEMITGKSYMPKCNDSLIEMLYSKFMDWNFELLGSSESYISRVYDRSQILYSDVDVTCLCVTPEQIGVN